MTSVGRDVPMPLYYQIKARILEAIDSGRLQAGDRIPSERDLTSQYNVSRMTARQALNELENQGYLYRVQGKGTFVAGPKLEQPLLGLTSFTEDMRRRGLEPGALVIGAAEVPAGRKVARILGVGESVPVYRLERLRFAGGVPMALEVSHIPAGLAPGLLDQQGLTQSLYGLLSNRFGVRLVSATQSLEAVAANAYEAEMLHVKEGVPLLLLERIASDVQDRPVEFVRSLYRGDRYRFTTELNRREESQ